MREYGRIRPYSLFILLVTSFISVVWQTRDDALQPLAVGAFGGAARVLVRRCLARDDEVLALLRGVAVEKGGVIFSGDAEQLPWADGARYFGRDDAAPSLLLPTTLQPDVPLSLFESALHRQVGVSSASAPPLLVWPEQKLVASLCDARPVVRARLLEWLDANFAADSFADEMDDLKPTFAEQVRP